MSTPPWASKAKTGMSTPRGDEVRSQASLWVGAIRSLGVAHRERISKHLLALEESDRYLRFGYVANEEQIRKYIEGINFERDDLFGIYNRRLELIAMAHVAYSVDKDFSSCAEFGVSVLKRYRSRGCGSIMFQRAIVHARNEGVQMLFIHALTENKSMIHIARKAGASVENDGSETNAYLLLPDASFESRLTEMVDEQLGQLNYGLNLQAKRFLGFLSKLQRDRQAVDDENQKSI
jgi:RimJ/RimL family protein N-acetyltransferase